MVNGPWVVMGDFNAYLYVDDKKGGSRPNFSSMKQFGECISQSHLIETEIVGEKYTWERDLLKEKIDWAFTSSEWNQLHPLTKVYHLNKFGSDHRPILLRSSPEMSQRRHDHRFRCQAAWFLEEGFDDIVRKSLEMEHWNEKIGKFSSFAREWNKKKVGSVEW
ncbi:hypothetical protein K1719_002659 [Acacia pycnantha]|nr:hypothetical protein K1719_002659 [Acacia pycnantha]